MIIIQPVKVSILHKQNKFLIVHKALLSTSEIKIRRVLEYEPAISQDNVCAASD